MGFSRKEAAEKLAAGDIGFLLEAELPAAPKAALSRLKAMTRVGPDFPFYAAFPVRAAENAAGNFTGTVTLSSLLFTLALENPSPLIRQAAAGELVLPVLETENTGFAQEVFSRLGKAKAGEEGTLADLRLACLYRLNRFADLAKLNTAAGKERQEGKLSSAGTVIPLLAGLKAEKSGRKKERNQAADIRSGLERFFFDSPADPLRSWALEELAGIESDFFSAAEKTALSGQAAVAGYDYGRGVLFFREAAENDPALFFRYPELISSLGRAFQYTAGAQEEGALLLAGWNARFEAGSPADADLRRIRYPILFYAGRIERQRGQYDDSTQWFTQALDFAPDGLQRDACIWYILMNALDGKPDTAAELVKTFIPRWSSPAYFSDVMDRLSRYLVSGRYWETLFELFTYIESRKIRGIITIRYAWLTGRAVEEGYIRSGKAPEDFFKIAFEEEADQSPASIYYRVMSASKLNVMFLPDLNHEPQVQPPQPAEAAGKKPELEFLLGFFDNGVGAYSLPFIRTMEKTLSIADLRRLAGALGEAGLNGESINLTAEYMNREDNEEGYKITREDMELFYPRRFQDLIEKYALETGIDREILFGLIRTESYFMPDVLSRSGAAGLTQLMESTALDMGGRLARRGGPDYRGVDGIDLEDPETNIHLGAVYLEYLIDYMGSPMLGLLAYNGGMGRVRRWRTGQERPGQPNLPLDLFLETVEFEETREYGRRVLAAAAMYGWLYYGKSMEAVAGDMYR